MVTNKPQVTFSRGTKSHSRSKKSSKKTSDGFAKSISVSIAQLHPSQTDMYDDTHPKAQRISQYSSHLRTAVEEEDALLKTWQGKKYMYPSAVTLVLL